MNAGKFLEYLKRLAISIFMGYTSKNGDLTCAS